MVIGQVIPQLSCLRDIICTCDYSVGVSRYLKAKNKGIKAVLADPPVSIE